MTAVSYSIHCYDCLCVRPSILVGFVVQWLLDVFVPTQIHGYTVERSWTTTRPTNVCSLVIHSLRRRTVRRGTGPGTLPAKLRPPRRANTQGRVGGTDSGLYHHRNTVRRTLEKSETTRRQLYVDFEGFSC